MQRTVQLIKMKDPALLKGLEMWHEIPGLKMQYDVTNLETDQKRSTQIYWVEGMMIELNIIV